MYKKLLILMAICLSLPESEKLYAQDKNVSAVAIAEKFVISALRDQKGYDWLRELCSIGPRLTGSSQSLQAIDWAKKTMAGCGIDRIWLQQVIVPNWKRGLPEQAVISRSSLFFKRQLTVAALGGSVGTGLAGISAPVIEVKSLAEIDSMKEKARGKIIFLNRPFDRTKLNPNEAYGGAVDQRTRGAARAGKVGAVAVLVRSVTSKYDNLPHTGVMYYDTSGVKIPAAAVGQIDADYLSSALQQEPDLELTLKLSCHINPDTISYNVIAEIRGSEFPQDIILVGGHLDSWDLGCGAQDDGGGCIHAMETLDLFRRMGIIPKRTIRCVLFIDEEQHQTGAERYAAWSDSSGQKHLAVIESDRGVLTPRGFNVDADSLILSKMQTWQKVLQTAGIDWIRKGGSGADVGKIKTASARLGYVPDPQRYFDFHHSANDNFESVHPRELELGTAAIATMVYLLSEEGL